MLAYFPASVDQFLCPFSISGPEPPPRARAAPWKHVHIRWALQAALDCELLEGGALADLALWALSLTQGLAGRGLLLTPSTPANPVSSTL